MKPYYSDEAVQIFHGDCREVLDDVWFGVDLLLTDPPYGMNHEPTRRGTGSKRWGKERVRGDGEPFDPAFLLRFPTMVLWGANWYASKVPDSGGWLVWDKRCDWENKGFTASDAELAWTNRGGMVRTFRMQWGGPVRGGEGVFHPTQKPVALKVMRWPNLPWQLVAIETPTVVVVARLDTGRNMTFRKRGVPAPTEPV